MLPAQFKPDIRTPGMAAPLSQHTATQEFSATQTVCVEKPAVITETERKKIIEEIQPVIYKEVVEPHVIKLTQNIHERIIEGAVYTMQTLPAKQLEQGKYDLNLGQTYGQNLGYQQFGNFQQFQQQAQTVNPVFLGQQQNLPQQSFGQQSSFSGMGGLNRYC